MALAKFIGRVKSFSQLNSMLRKKVASLAVITGRRRIGKSRLIDEFIRKKTHFKFVGLAPDKKTTAQDQRNHFMYQLQAQLGIPEVIVDDWSKVFAFLAERVKKGRVIIVFDEITWIGSKDPLFLSKLQYAWETWFSKNNNLVLILCGSVSAWIEKNIMSSTGYFGRIATRITLDELSITSSNALLNEVGFKYASYEKLLLLSVMGGVPWYLEQVDPGHSALGNIKNSCFTKDGFLIDEYDRIFHDLFQDKRSDIYRRIVKILSKQRLDYAGIATHLKYVSSGALSDYLEELMISGFVERDYTWLLKTGKESSLSTYRLKDNYLRFYLKFIHPKLNQIKRQRIESISLETLSGWGSTMGFQFENLILNNRELVIEALKIDPASIVYDNPFFQRKTVKQKGCQIDYLIQTKHNTLYVCEIKFNQKPLTRKVITEMKEKINRISVPHGFACIPVLIHANGVVNNLSAEDYFSHIIDARKWLIT